MRPALHTAPVVVTLDPERSVQRDAGVLVAEGRVAAIGPARRLAAEHPSAVRVEHGQRWVVPGLHNAHGHLAGWSPDAPLEVFLLSRYTADSAEQTYRRALATGVALVRSGVVWTHHLHYGAHAAETIRGYRDAGVRLQFCLGALDRYSVLPYDGDNARLRAKLPADLARALERQRPGKPIESVERYVERSQELRDAFSHDPDVEVIAGPDNPQWCSDACLTRLQELGVALHLHCQETAAQRAWAVRATGMSPVARLEQLGALGPDVTLAHMTHASDEDLAIVARAGATVAWNPASNLRLGSGVTRVRDMAKAGIPLRLGVDGAGFADDCDMLAETRLGAILQRALDTDAPALSDLEMLSIAMRPLVPGARADLVVVDPLPGPDPVRALIRRASSSHVHSVFVDGRPLIPDRVLRAGRGAELPPGAPETALATALAPYLSAQLETAERRDAVATGS